LLFGKGDRMEMPRYFLHIRDEDDFSQDREGQELPDLEAARHEAISAARELIGERLLHGGAIDGRQIEITDETSTVLAVVNSGDVIYCDGRFSCFVDDVTRSAPVTNPISVKPAEK
jgi:hypothetical protein